MNEEKETNKINQFFLTYNTIHYETVVTYTFLSKKMREQLFFSLIFRHSFNDLELTSNYDSSTQDNFLLMKSATHGSS